MWKVGKYSGDNYDIHIDHDTAIKIAEEVIRNKSRSKLEDNRLVSLVNATVTNYNTEWYKIMKQVSVSMNDSLEDVIKKCANNTTKKYMIYNHKVMDDHRIVLEFDLFDSDEQLEKGYLVNLDEVRKWSKDN